MIKEWYPSTRAVQAIGNVFQQQQHHHSASDYQRAQRLGITVVELNKRENIIRGEVNRLPFKVRQELYPVRFQDYQQYGKVILEAVAYNTIQYGNAPWDEKCPQILQVCLASDPNKRLDCSISWLSATEPVEESTC